MASGSEGGKIGGLLRDDVREGAWMAIVGLVFWEDRVPLEMKRFLNVIPQERSEVCF